MKRLWVALVFLGVVLVLFLGRPALPGNPLLEALSKKLDALEESMALDKQISLLQVSRFMDNGDGTVRDNLTGLVWMKNGGNADGADGFGELNWDLACEACARLNDGEHGLTDGSAEGDWRLPSMRELHSLVDYSEYSPALPAGHPFTGVQPSPYWSSTIYAGDTDHAWRWNFFDGGLDAVSKSGVRYVWCVRGGQ